MIILDTTILVYAIGGGHPLREPCRRVLRAHGDGLVTAATTVEVLQEFVHVFARRRDRATAIDARWILVVPCCVASSLPAARRASARADALGMPRGEVRRKFLESLVTTERMLELEARGWRTEVVAFAGATVTPYNHLLRAERMREPGRMANARARLDALRG